MTECRRSSPDRKEGPEGEPPVIRPATGELRQIVRWGRRHYQATQAVFVVMAMTLTALALQIIRWVRRHYWAVQAVLVVTQGNESRLTRLWLQGAENVQQVLRVPGGALAAALD